MKKRIYHSNMTATRRGRTLNALLSLLLGDRYGLVITLKVIIVKREFKNDPIKRRALRDLYTAIVVLPIAFITTLCVEKCNGRPTPFDAVPADSVHCAPSVSDSLTFARPNARTLAVSVPSPDPFARCCSLLERVQSPTPIVCSGHP